MNQPYTFCLKENCEETTCCRHKNNILQPEDPHSFANIDKTDLCQIRNKDILNIQVFDFTNST